MLFVRPVDPTKYERGSNGCENLSEGHSEYERLGVGAEDRGCLIHFSESIVRII